MSTSPGDERGHGSCHPAPNSPWGDPVQGERHVSGPDLETRSPAKRIPLTLPDSGRGISVSQGYHTPLSPSARPVLGTQAPPTSANRRVVPRTEGPCLRTHDTGTSSPRAETSRKTVDPCAGGRKKESPVKDSFPGCTKVGEVSREHTFRGGEGAVGATPP